MAIDTIDAVQAILDDGSRLEQVLRNVYAEYPHTCEAQLHIVRRATLRRVRNAMAAFADSRAHAHEGSI